jgi:hypothetical protein
MNLRIRSFVGKKKTQSMVWTFKCGIKTQRIVHLIVTALQREVFSERISMEIAESAILTGFLREFV